MRKSISEGSLSLTFYSKFKLKFKISYFFRLASNFDLQQKMIMYEIRFIQLQTWNCELKIENSVIKQDLYKALVLLLTKPLEEKLSLARLITTLMANNKKKSKTL